MAVIARQAGSADVAAVTVQPVGLAVVGGCDGEPLVLLLLVVEGRVGGKLGIVQQLHHSFLTQAPVTRVTLKGHFFT